MSQLVLDRDDIERAVKQYYQDYEPELYKKFDFSNLTIRYKTASIGYTDLITEVPEKSYDERTQQPE